MANAAPSVSIIIPSYNSLDTLPATLESLFLQTYKDFEILLIDDGSTDDTRSWLSGIQDPRLKVFHFGNGGLATARNRGIQASGGKFLSFLDADDLWAPKKLEHQILALNNAPDCGLAYSWNLGICAESRVLYKHRPCYVAGDAYASILQGNFIGCGSNALFRREVVEKVGHFNEALPAAEDWDYFIRASEAGCHYTVVTRYEVSYRQRPGSMSGNVETMRKAGYKVIESAYSRAPESLRHLRRTSLARFHFYLAILGIRGSQNWGSYLKALTDFVTGIRLQPDSVLTRDALNVLRHALILPWRKLAEAPRAFLT